jgi:hypothetical protein
MTAFMRRIWCILFHDKHRDWWPTGISEYAGACAKCGRTWTGIDGG